jgi:hypothetical protein
MTPPLITASKQKTAVLHIVAGPYQAVGWQQEPGWLYSLSTPSASYKIFIHNMKKFMKRSASFRNSFQEHVLKILLIYQNCAYGYN